MTEHFNKLTPTEAEALAILSEECAEVVQIVSKIQRHGLESTNPIDPRSRTNQALLLKELGDVLAAMELCRRVGLVNAGAVDFCKTAKLMNIGKWLHHVKLEDDAPEERP